MYSTGMETPTLQDVIRQHIQLPSRANGRGFFSVLCNICKDHGKKGKRAGFKFEGDVVGYNCFNCGHRAKYDPVEHETMPSSMADVLLSFGIPEIDWQPALFHGMELREAGAKGVLPPSLLKLEPNKLTFPPYFYPLTNDENDDFAQYAIQYLKSRQIDWTTAPFFLVRKTNDPDNSRWYGRLIIPTYKNNKLVFWQGRDLTDIHVKKYLSPDQPRDNIISGYDHLKEFSDDPLYVVEGWFDAHHLNGVAVYGNKMTPEQVAILNKTARRKVVIPDRQGDGQLLAEQALELGWSISTPDIGSCKDVNDAVVKYGLLYTRMSILQHTTNDPFAAQVQLGVYCEGKSNKGKRTHKAPPQVTW